MTGIRRALVCVAVFALMAGPTARLAAVRAETGDDVRLVAKSLVSQGDTARLKHALAKARRGEKVTVAVIGGSITQGASASAPEKNYGSLIASWWRTTFPKAQVQFVNAGIGATGSDYGTLRARRDLLAKRPDFVVVEYGVNDANSQQSAETVEGLVRQVLREPQQPAVVLLFTMNRNGGNAQEWQGKVGRHYRLPMVSFRDALWPEIEAGRMKWEDVEADVVHPNDRGHAYLAQFVTSLLETTLKALPDDSRLAKIEPIAKPLFGEVYDHVKLWEADDLRPVSQSGWTHDAANHCWKSDTAGSAIEFEIEGKSVFLMEWKIRGPMGKAKIQVDDREPVIHDAWFDQTWGGWRCTTELARDLSAGKHRVRVEILADKHPESTGREFRILGLGAAGVPSK